MTWPTVAVDTTGMDAGTDTPPRAAILDLAQKVNLMIASPPSNDGRLVGIQVFRTVGSATYTPTAGTNKVRVHCQAGGGAGGGSAATSGSQSSVGAGGAAGASFDLWLTAAFSGATVIVGAGGVAASGSVGGSGGASEFTTGATTRRANGGAGGSAGSASSTFPRSTATSSSSAGLSIGGSYQEISMNPGSPGGDGISLSTILSSPGVGASAALGTAAPQKWKTGGTGSGSSGYGAGGAGSCVGPSGSAVAGENGQQGIVIVWEYS